MKRIQSTHNTSPDLVQKTGTSLFGIKAALARTAGLFSLVLIFSLPLQAAENGNPGDRNDPRNTQRSVIPENSVNNLTAQRISRRQASNIASSRYEGRVLSILMDNSTNNWRVRMDRDGTVFNVFINASSGDVKASSD